jgi:hypothetical protein
MYLQGHTKATIHGGSLLEATASITACVSRVKISRTAVGKSVQQNEIFPLPVRHSDLETVFLKQKFYQRFSTILTVLLHKRTNLGPYYTVMRFSICLYNTSGY